VKDGILYFFGVVALLVKAAVWTFAAVVVLHFVVKWW
jgi:hypothetical protein